jgi:hypothetical protein
MWMTSGISEMHFSSSYEIKQTNAESPESHRESARLIKNIKFFCNNIDIRLDKFDLSGIFLPYY